MVQKRLRRETVALLSLDKKRGWHYYATIERDRRVCVYARPAEDTLARNPELVLDPGVQAVPGSYYEVTGKRLVRRYDPKRGARLARAEALRAKRMRAARAKPFVDALKEIEQCLGNKASLFDEGYYDLAGFVVFRVRARRKAALEVAELQQRFLGRGALVFHLDPPQSRGRHSDVGVMATRDPRDVVHLLQNIENAGVGVEDVLEVVGPLIETGIALPEAANVDYLLLRFRAIPRNHKSLCREMISKLALEVDSADELAAMDRDLVENGQVLLWWD